MRPSPSKTMKRVLVVPWSIAPIYFFKCLALSRFQCPQKSAKFSGVIGDCVGLLGRAPAFFAGQQFPRYRSRGQSLPPPVHLYARPPRQQIFNRLRHFETNGIDQLGLDRRRARTDPRPPIGVFAQQGEHLQRTSAELSRQMPRDIRRQSILSLKFSCEILVV